MKFSLAAVGAILAVVVSSSSVAEAASSSSSSFLQVHSGFLSQEEIAATVEQAATSPSMYLGDGKTQGSAQVHNDVVRHLKEEVVGAAIDMEIGAVVEDKNDFFHQQIRTTILEQTTTPHIDHVVEDAVIVDEDVAFIFLNDNPDAVFVHGDDKIPVVAGDMVVFKGGQVQHNTIINDGVVHLLGPFETRSLKAVGGICVGDCTRCNSPSSTPQFCITAEGKEPCPTFADAPTSGLVCKGVATKCNGVCTEDASILACEESSGKEPKSAKAPKSSGSMGI